MLRKSPSPRPRVSRSAILDEKKIDLDKQAERLSEEQKKQAEVEERLHQREVFLQERESALHDSAAELELGRAALKEDRAQVERLKRAFSEATLLLPPDLRVDVRRGLSAQIGRERSRATPSRK
jgi:hypothetical protein